MSREQIFGQPSFLPAFEDFSCFEGATIGITGSRGMLGTILSNRLRGAKVEVVPFNGDVTKADHLAPWFLSHRFTHFFHLAGQVSVNPRTAGAINSFEANVLGVFNACASLVAAPSQNDCWSFFSSSSHVYARSRGAAIRQCIGEDAVLSPSSTYGETKLLGEAAARFVLSEFERPFMIGRIFSVAHASQPEPFLIPILLRKLDAAKPGDTIELVNPDSVRDFLDAESVIDAALWLAKARATGVSNIGSGEAKSVRDVAVELGARSSKPLRFTGKSVEPPDGLVADVTRLKTLLRSPD